jgi:hypothetical protein
MKHEVLFIEITEWLEEATTRRPIDALVEAINFLGERDYRSLEISIANLLNDFIGISS